MSYLANNPFYTALREGRWSPTVEVDEQKDGNYRAHYTDGEGKTIEHISSSFSDAHNQLLENLIEEVRVGNIRP